MLNQTIIDYNKADFDKMSMFCKRSNLVNEADVETWFMDKLLSYLRYSADDIKLKKSLKEYMVGHGSESSLYKPDYVVSVKKFPVLVIDAKSPDENIDDWTSQCSSYCLEINKQFEHNPVEYYMISNGFSTSLYKWDKSEPLITLGFEDFHESSLKLIKLRELIEKENLEQTAIRKFDTHMDSLFEFKTVSLDEISNLFHNLHQFIWKTEKTEPTFAFEELMKIVFIKIKKDKELYAKLGPNAKPKTKDVVFSVAWIKNQTEIEDPINDPLFKNLLNDLEKEIHQKNKKRIFDRGEEIKLRASTTQKIVSELEHIDFARMDEDIHGRMFESFLDATARGKALGQFFTPRNIVTLMVGLSNITVTKSRIDSVLDACCGSGGFLISAMNDMYKKVDNLAGLSNKEKEQIKKKIVDENLVGIDAGSEPPMYRIARMNMYLHGDGGSRIYFADSLDKTLGQLGRSNLEHDEQIAELRKMLIGKKKKFDVILSNPPFSMRYSRETNNQMEILNQYELSTYSKKSTSLLSSTMFLERYRDLVSEDGRILAVIDDSVLSGESYKSIRDYIRKTFIIIGIISLPGDAFKHADSRVKTSVLILRLKKSGEEQPDIFVERSIYLGLTTKIAKKIGIDESELSSGKRDELTRIIKNFRDFLDGKRTEQIVSGSSIADRLDAKHCINDNSRLKSYWISRNLGVAHLDRVLSRAKNRSVRVSENDDYTFLKVTYDGEVLEAETKDGEEISYSRLNKVREWDILFSNMGVGRGSIGVVPTYYAGKYVSEEYTVLTAKSKEEALFYSNILRTKEILGDILSSTTGLNRGRIKWTEMANIEVPLYDERKHKMKDAVIRLDDLWTAYFKYNNYKNERVKDLAGQLKLESEESRKRWLANKPPE